MSYSFSSNIKKRYYKIFAKEDGATTYSPDTVPNPRNASELAMQCQVYQKKNDDTGETYVDSNGRQRVSIVTGEIRTTFITQFNRHYYVGVEDAGDDGVLYIEDSDLNLTAAGSEKAILFSHEAPSAVMTIKDNSSEENTLCSMSYGDIAVIYKIDDDSWDAYVLTASLDDQFYPFVQIGACEENPTIEAEHGSINDSEGNMIVTSETVNFSFTDMNVTKDNYDALRSLSGNLSIVYLGEYNTTLDNYDCAELITGINTKILPAVGEDRKISISGSKTGRDLDEFYVAF